MFFILRNPEETSSTNDLGYNIIICIHLQLDYISEFPFDVEWAGVCISFDYVLIKSRAFLQQESRPQLLGPDCNMCRLQDLVPDGGVPCGKAHMGIT